MIAMVAALALAGPLCAQQQKKFDPELLTLGVDMQRVEGAIQKGVLFLRTAPSPGHGAGGPNSDELILYTLITAGVPETDPKAAELLKRILEAPLERTYKTALQAMVLEEIHRVRYQPRIEQCAQFLIDNQCVNGQWSYGGPTEAAKGTPSVASGGGDKVKSSESLPPPGPRSKPKITSWPRVKRTRDGPASGDNSNSQYAALGLRACYDSGIQIPKDTFNLARRWWRESQFSRAGKGKDDRPSVATGGGGDPRGWCYDGKDSHEAYGSMTAGAIGALVIYAYMLDTRWTSDDHILNGLAWMAANWSVTANTGNMGAHHGGTPNSTMYHYYLYGVERVGMLYGTDNIGGHYWYAEGARHLLQTQKKEGKWEGSGWSNPTWDTCFAILFLKRATRPLTPSGAAGDR